MNASTYPIGREASWRQRAAPLLNRCVHIGIAAYVIFAVLGFMGSEVNSFDEGLQLLGGRGVLEGKIPHHDFWSLYPPLNYYLNAGIFRVCKPSFIAARLVTVVLYGGAVLALSRYVLARLAEQSAPVRWATLALSIFSLTRVLGLSQNNTLLAAILLLVYCVSEFERKGAVSTRALVISGLLSGMLTVMRLNLGFYAVGALGATLTLFAEPPFFRAPLRCLRQLLTYLLCVCVVPALFLLSYRHFAIEVLDQIALAPTLILRAGHLVDPSADPIAYETTFGVIGFAVACARIDWRNRRECATCLVVAGTTLVLAAVALRFLAASHLLLVPYAVPTVLVGALFASQVAWRRFTAGVLLSLFFLAACMQHYLIRADGLHLFILSGAVALATATGIASQPQLPRVASMGLLFWFMMHFPLPTNHVGIAQWLWPGSPNGVVPAIRVLSDRKSFLALGDSARLSNGEPLREFEQRFFPDADEISVIRYIARFASHNDAVFLGLSSHDRTRVNDTRLSWLMPRPLASHYWDLEPGIITSESVQREVVASLGSGVRWLVLEDTATSGTALYPFERSSFLDHYIDANYRCPVQYGKLEVCCRVDACPVPSN